MLQVIMKHEPELLYTKHWTLKAN